MASMKPAIGQSRASSQSQQVTRREAEAMPDHAHDAPAASLDAALHTQARVESKDGVLRVVEPRLLDVLQAVRPVRYAYEAFRFYQTHPDALKTELLSGCTIAVMQIPESIAFAFVAGVRPLVGLYATFFMGVITGAFGGKPGMVAGAAGAMAVVLADVMDDSGPLKDKSLDQRFEHLLMVVFMCGIFQIACSLLQLAKLAKLIPQAAMVGFMNGLAIIIFKSQLPAFQVCTFGKTAKDPKQPLFMECAESERTWLSLHDQQTWYTLVLLALAMLILWLQPKIPKYGKLVPASLTAIVVGTLWEQFVHREALGVSTRIVGETTTLAGGLPSFHFPDVSGEGDANWDVILQYSIMLCAIGLIESVMTLQAMDQITKNIPSSIRSNQECFAQGLANVMCGMFGAMGGCAMVGQSTINIMNGARGRLSAILGGMFIFCIVVAIGSVIELIPIATLTGVLFVVVMNTFEWNTFTLLRKASMQDAFIIIEVTVLAVVFDLAIAVITGVVTAALFYAWNTGEEFKTTLCDEMTPGGKAVSVYHLHTPLFFGSSRNFSNFFINTDELPDLVVVDFTRSYLGDHSAAHALDNVGRQMREMGKTLFVMGLDERAVGLLLKAEEMVVHVELIENLSDVDDIVDCGKHKQKKAAISRRMYQWVASLARNRSAEVTPSELSQSHGAEVELHQVQGASRVYDSEANI